jgi:hypothetical protein
MNAKDEQAEVCYHHHGFAAFGAVVRYLIMPLAKARRSYWSNVPLINATEAVLSPLRIATVW